MRAKIGRIFVDLEVLRYAALRILSNLEKGERPGPDSSITKLSYSEIEKRYQELVQEILGPWGQAMAGGPDGFSELDTSSGEPGTWATTSSGRGRGRSTRAPRRSRRTSSASGCSGCRGKPAPTGSGPRRARGLRPQRRPAAPARHRPRVPRRARDAGRRPRAVGRSARRARRLWKQLARLGWLGLALPEAHGGSGLGHDRDCRGAGGDGPRRLPGPYFETVVAARAIEAGGSPAQQAR